MPKIRHDCKGGKRCFLKYKHPNIEVFDDCFGPQDSVGFGDIDMMIERRQHFIWGEWKEGRLHPKNGQHFSYLSLMLDRRHVVFVMDGNAEHTVLKRLRMYYDGWIWEYNATVEQVKPAFSVWWREMSQLTLVKRRLMPAQLFDWHDMLVAGGCRFIQRFKP